MVAQNGTLPAEPRPLQRSLPARPTPAGAADRRWPAVLGSALIAALAGVVLAAFAHSVSSSLLAKAVVVGSGGVVGGVAGRTAGAALGLVCGAVAAAVLTAVGGSTVAVAALVVGCTALGGWLQYVHSHKQVSGARDRAARSFLRRDDEPHDLAAGPVPARAGDNGIAVRLRDRL